MANAGPAISVGTFAANIRDLADPRAILATSNAIAAIASDPASKDFRSKIALGIATMTSTFDGRQIDEYYGRPGRGML